MPKLYRRKTVAGDLNHNDLANIGASDHHAKYTDPEAVAAAKADADIADAITKKHSQNTDNKLQQSGVDVVSTEPDGQVNFPKQSRVRAYRATSNQVIPSATTTKVQLNAKNYDSQGEFDEITNYRFTAKKAGYYLVIGTVYWDTFTDQCRLMALFFKNGAAGTWNTIRASDTSYISNTVSDIMYLAVNDYIELMAYQDSGANVEIRYDERGTWLAIHKLS